jgi:LacI family transcriptional regulator
MAQNRLDPRGTRRLRTRQRPFLAEHVRLHGPWSIYLAERGLGEAPPGWLKAWKGDGIIARIENRRIARTVADLGLPTVDLRGLLHDLGMPVIATDDGAVARLALDHFLERGFRHFAFCGFPGADYSDQRSEGYIRLVAERGCDCHVYQSSNPCPEAGTEAREQWGWMTEAEVASWIAGLPKPVGLMACNDIRAQQLLSACRAIAAAVPDEVAVLGVDNDEVLCDLSDPPLSSIVPDTHRIGREAAARLESMMGGAARQATLTVIPPLGVVTRRSTDVLAVDDRAISRAARFIREHACEPITTQDVLAHLPLSRSVFERRYTKVFGRTPKAEIQRIRLEGVKRLLAETDWPLKQIASNSGFDHPEYMCAAFKKHTGQTPGEYRRSAQERK